MRDILIKFASVVLFFLCIGVFVHFYKDSLWLALAAAAGFGIVSYGVLFMFEDDDFCDDVLEFIKNAWHFAIFVLCVAAFFFLWLGKEYSFWLAALSAIGGAGILYALGELFATVAASVWETLNAPPETPRRVSLSNDPNLKIQAQKNAVERLNDLYKNRARRLVNQQGVFIGGVPQLRIDDKGHVSPSFFPLRVSGDGHVLTFGKTGKGKGSTVLVPALLDYKGSAFVVDPKGQLAAVTSAQRQAMGQKTYYLNPFDMHGIPSSSYNPLDFIDPQALDFETQCLTIAEGLLIQSAKMDHWDISALDLISLLIQWVIVEGEENGFPRDIISVREILSFSKDDRCQFFESMTGSKHPHIAQGAGRYAGDSKEVQDCVQTANVQLAFLRNTGYERLFRSEKNSLSPFSFATLKKEAATVYLIIPPENLKTHGRFLRLLFMSAYNELMKTKSRQEVLFVLDEFLQLGHLAIIGEASRICRENLLKFWLIVQDLPGFKGVYEAKNEWESLIANAGVLQIFSADDVTTQDYFEKLSGTVPVKVENTNFSTSTTEANNWGRNEGISTGGPSGSQSVGTSEGGSKSTTQTASKSINERIDPKIRRHDLRALSLCQQLVFLSEESYPLEVLRFPYWNLLGEDFAALDPYHMDDETRGNWLSWVASGKSLFSRPMQGNKPAQLSNENINFPPAIFEEIKKDLGPLVEEEHNRVVIAAERQQSCYVG
jgi:hypothetical protein